MSMSPPLAESAEESSPAGPSDAVFAAGLGRFVPIADAVDRPEAVQLAAMVFEGVADLGHVLVQRTAADVGVHAPDGVDQAVPADDHAGIGVQMVEDAELLASEFVLLAAGEDELEALGMDFRSVEEEDVGAERGVDGEPAVAPRSRCGAARRGCAR